MLIMWIFKFSNFQGKKMPKVPCKFLSIIMQRKAKKSKEKVLSSNTFRRIQIWTKMENLIDDDESDNDSNDGTESNNEKDHEESNE